MERKKFPESGHYKVVQLDISDEPYLALGNREDFHKNILSNILTDAGIEHDKEFPTLTGESYIVKGMGFVYILERRKLAKFSGESGDYTIGIDKTHLERIAEHYPEWELRN